eukprot:705748-Rhodomonas_salina.1
MVRPESPAMRYAKGADVFLYCGRWLSLTSPTHPDPEPAGLGESFDVLLLLVGEWEGLAPWGRVGELELSGEGGEEWGRLGIGCAEGMVAASGGGGVGLGYGEAAQGGRAAEEGCEEEEGARWAGSNRLYVSTGARAGLRTMSVLGTLCCARRG